MVAIFDEIITKMNFICITTGIDIPTIKIEQFNPFHLCNMIYFVEVG